MDESVLCLPAAHVRAVCRIQGFQAASEAEAAALLDPAQFSFRPRSITETDPNFLQLIPYVVLGCGDRVFHYRRGAAGSEKRLGGLRSLGIGGHISEADAAGGNDPYRTGLQREVDEEIADVGPYTETFLGLIFDESTLVGRVHLGLAYRWNCVESSAAPREAALVASGWANRGELLACRNEFEPWSRFILDTWNGDTERL